MDHSANLMLVSPAAEYQGYIEPPFAVERLLPVLEALARRP
jgi:hypothetical protein